MCVDLVLTLRKWRLIYMLCLCVLVWGWRAIVFCVVWTVIHIYRPAVSECLAVFVCDLYIVFTEQHFQLMAIIVTMGCYGIVM